MLAPEGAKCPGFQGRGFSRVSFLIQSVKTQIKQDYKPTNPRVPTMNLGWLNWRKDYKDSEK